MDSKGHKVARKFAPFAARQKRRENPVVQADSRSAHEGEDGAACATGVDSAAVPSLNSQHEEEEIQEEKEPILTIGLHGNAIKDWLLIFADCVRKRDYTKAEQMFCLNMVGFGTKARRAASLQWLRTEQWEKTWPKTTDFEFNFDELDFYHDAHMAHVAVTWKSTGYRLGFAYKRSGRASLLLVGTSSEVKCAASHFSLDP